MSLSKKEKNKRFVKYLFNLSRALDIPAMIKPYHLKKSQKIIEKEIETFKKGFDATNPVSFTPKDAKKIFTKLLTFNFEL